MDAAQTTKKIVFCFAGALLLAGAASAQTLVVSTNTVTFNSFVNSVPITVSSTGDNFQFTIGAHSSWYTPAPGTVYTTPATVFVTRVLGNCQQLDSARRTSTSPTTVCRRTSRRSPFRLTPPTTPGRRP